VDRKVNNNQRHDMTQGQSPALQVALAYHGAWTAKDFERATTGVRMIAAFGDADTAVVMYNTETIPVSDQLAPAGCWSASADGQQTVMAEPVFVLVTCRGL